MFPHAVLLALVACAVCGQSPAPKIINDKIDAQMRAHNEMLTHRHLESLPLNEDTVDGITFGKGFQLGANTMHRTGDGTEETADNGKSTAYRYRIGFRTLGLAFDKVRFEDGKEVAKPRFKVTTNSIHFDFTVSGKKGDPGCRVTLDEYKFAELEGLQAVEGQFSQEELSNLRKVIMAYMNKALEKKKPQVESHLQPLCKQSASSSK